MTAPRRLYCTERSVPVAEVIQYVPNSACRTCSDETATEWWRHAPLSTPDHAVVRFTDGYARTVPVASLEALLEDVSPM